MPNQVSVYKNYHRNVALSKLEVLHSIIYTMKEENHQNIPYLNMLRGELLLLKFKLQDHQVNIKRKISSVLEPTAFKNEDQETTIDTLYNNVDQLIEENFIITAKKARKCKKL